MVDVSILITCFNKEKYLDECVQSILRQTKQPLEIIIVHDACRKPMHHVNANSIFLKDNVGVSKARHEAFRFSKGKLVLFVDGDDVLSPDYLEKMILVLTKGSDVIYPDIFHWGGNSRLTVIPKRITPAFVKDHERVVIPVTCLIKRELYEKLGGFKEFPVLEDLDFWIRAMVLGSKFSKAETLLWYRHTPESRNSMPLDRKKVIIKKILDQFIFEKDKILWQK